MADTPTFADHFSDQAGAYARHRPGYPRALFAHLAALAPSRLCCWDCATGSGQAARLLAPHFRVVVATDASAAQVRRAVGPANVTFRVAPAERSGLPRRGVDLVTVAQALHWLDLPAFYAEVRRVARPGAVLAAWTYDLPAVDAAVDRVVRRFHDRTVGPHWPPERALVTARYRTLPFPFARIPLPAFPMTARWDLRAFFGFLGTWSAVAVCRRATRADPMDRLRAPLAAAWGPAGRVRTVRWPLTVLAGRLRGGHGQCRSPGQKPE